MAKAGKGILDGFRGSIAQTTGSKDKGKSVIRAKPKNSPKTQTPGLIQSKEDFKFAMRIYDWFVSSGWAALIQPKLKNTTVQAEITKLAKLFSTKDTILNRKVYMFECNNKSQRYTTNIDPNVGFQARCINWGNFVEPATAKSTDRIFFLKYMTELDSFTGLHPNIYTRNFPADQQWCQSDGIPAGEGMFVLCMIFSEDFNIKYSGSFSTWIRPL